MSIDSLVADNEKSYSSMFGKEMTLQANGYKNIPVSMN